MSFLPGDKHRVLVTLHKGVCMPRESKQEQMVTGVSGVPAMLGTFVLSVNIHPFFIFQKCYKKFFLSAGDNTHPPLIALCCNELHILLSF